MIILSSFSMILLGKEKYAKIVKIEYSIIIVVVVLSTTFPTHLLVGLAKELQIGIVEYWLRNRYTVKANVPKTLQSNLNPTTSIFSFSEIS